MLILASSSPYRRELLQRLGLPFRTENPAVDESPHPGEAGDALTARLAAAKAEAVAGRNPGAMVIGSDQVAECDGAILGKPGSEERAVAQLLACSGHCVNFLTSVAVRRPDGAMLQDLSITRVRFRDLSVQEVRRYVERDRPLDCAGSFRSEAGGVMLLASMESDDPTAIIGLPLIRLAAMLRQAGYSLP